MPKKIVFVLGAGASKEVNLPTGVDLMKLISKSLDIRFDYNRQVKGDSTITQALRQIAQTSEIVSGDINPYLDEARHIRDALPLAISIDNFIDQHKENEKIALCGKLAIVKSILNAESKSLLKFKDSNLNATINFNDLEETWYLDFFKLLTENCQKDKLKERFNQITLIIFNYDRCVEHFLVEALKKFYRLNNQEATEIIQHLSILHPYGSIGTIFNGHAKDNIPFGTNPSAEQLLNLAKQIKTFTEGTDPSSSQIQEIKEQVARATHLCFLGFAFHKLNMNLIKPVSTIKHQNIVRIFASAYGISESNKEQIKQAISMLYNNYETGIQIKNIPCCKFFNEYWNSLTF